MEDKSVARKRVARKRVVRKRVVNKSEARKRESRRSAGRPRNSIVVPKCYIWAKQLQMELRYKNYSIARWLDGIDINVLLNYDELKPIEKRDFDLCTRLIRRKTDMPISLFFLEQETRLSLLKKILLKEEDSTSKETEPNDHEYKTFTKKSFFERLKDLFVCTDKSGADKSRR